MDDQASGRSSVSETKCEPLNSQNNSKVENVTLKQENKSDSYVSGASMAAESELKCEKSNVTMKRSTTQTASLLISKLPKHFSLQQIKEHLEKLCGNCEVRDFKSKEEGGVVLVTFKNVQQMIDAKKILNSESIDGANIQAADADDNMEQDEAPPLKRKKEDEEDGEPWGLDMDVWRTDPKGLYGVKPGYLARLGLTDSLRNWVLVLNFRCGKEDLREVMELAGTVLVCSVHNRRSSHTANVMYSHPLEALQAISMLNGQMLYGKPLTVKMLKSNGAILPKGLNNVGPGLAKYGKPARDVVRHYERFVKGQSCALDTNLFRTPEEQATDDAENVTDSENSRRRAKIAMENLVSGGIDIKDLVFALKEIIAEHKEEEKEHLISELNDIDEDDKSDLNASDTNMVVIRLNNGEGNNDLSGNSADRLKVKANTNVHIASLVSLPSSDSGSIPIFLGSTSQSGRSTPSPSSIPRRPGNPVVPIGSSSGSSSSIGVTVDPALLPTACNQMYPPNTPRTQFLRPMHRVFGPNGNMSGPTRFVPMVGPMTTAICRPVVSPMSGPLGGSISVAISGQISNPMGVPGGAMSGLGRMMSGHGSPMPGPNFAMPGPNTHPPFGPTVHPTAGSGATLQFSNLPPTTTFALLSDKLAKIGQLVSIQFTVPGCVVAKYAHRSHAEMCIKQFDKTCLDGNIIDVRFI